MPDPVDVFFVDVDRAASALEAAEARVPRLSPDQIHRFEKLALKSPADAKRWRCSHIALRLVLERRAGAGLRGVPYQIEPGGRPALPSAADVARPLHFSLAHSGNCAVIAASDLDPLGADIEASRVLTVSPERRSRVEAAGQALAPCVQLPEAPDARFLQAWVRLEAVAKANGRGIGRTLTEAGVIGGPTRRAMPASIGDLTVEDLQLPEGCFGAVAGRQLPASLTVQRFPIDSAGIDRFLSAAPGASGAPLIR